MGIIDKTREAIRRRVNPTQEEKNSDYRRKERRLADKEKNLRLKEREAKIRQREQRLRQPHNRDNGYSMANYEDNKKKMDALFGVGNGKGRDSDLEKRFRGLI